MRGLCSPYLSPTKANVFNKFSVRYMVQVKVIVSKPQIEEAEHDEFEQQYGQEDGGDEEKQSECEFEDPAIIGGQQEIVLWR